MGRTTLVISLAALAGCSFVDDFDKFKSLEENVAPSEDGGSTDQRDAETDATGQVRNDAATPPARDAAMEDASATPLDSSAGDAALGDAAVVDAYVPPPPPPPCAGTVCNDNDACTRDTCESDKCVYKPIDADGDGFSPGVCKPGSIAKGGDCDDTKNAIKPSASEVCDGVDNNCNGMIDEGFNKLQCYPDLDRDDFGNLDGKPVAECAKCPEFTVAVDAPTVDRAKKHDCWDDPASRGEFVFPGQTTPQEIGYGPGGKSERKWDYDCSGTVDKEFGVVGSCGPLLNLLLCTGERGYIDEPVPECGESGRLRTCGSNGVDCSGVVATVLQRCL